jgi:hypothetical protein
MMMELALCILVSLDDKIQTAQPIVVAGFSGELPSFPENQVRESGNLGDRIEIALVLFDSSGAAKHGRQGDSRGPGTNGREKIRHRS